VLDAIKLPKDFDIDDISISHDSEYAEPGEDDGRNLTSILQSVIDDLIEQSGNKIKDDDI
jgi:hypothetical protein